MERLAQFTTVQTSIKFPKRPKVLLPVDLPTDMIMYIHSQYPNVLNTSGELPWLP